MILQSLLFASTGGLLFCITLYAVAFHPHFLRKLLALNIMGSAVFLVLVSIAARAPGAAPDPVPLAMVLTGIVVAVAATAFGLVLARRIHEETGQRSLPEEEKE